MFPIVFEKVRVGGMAMGGVCAQVRTRAPYAGNIALFLLS